MIPLAVPWLKGKEAKYLLECVETNFVSSVGPFVERFEKEVAAISGAEFGIATCSGTCGLHLALTTLGVGRDDLVILPSFTFIASANAISHCGAQPWLFDINESSWTLSASLLEQVLESSTRQKKGQLFHKETGKRIAAIMPVYTLGNPADMEPIANLAAEYGLPIVVDAACAIGATYRGKTIGHLADFSVFSFNGNKTITAGGGGMLVTNNPELGQRAKHLSTTARVGRDYHHDEIGFNYRLTNIQAAVGCAQLENLDYFIQRKKEIDRRYRESFAGNDNVGFFPMLDWAEGTHWFSGVVLKDSSKLRFVIEQLNDAGIGARPFWKPVHKQPPYNKCLKESLKTSEDIWDRILTLPCSTSLEDGDLDNIISKTQKLLN